jgi:hypothetical protein
MRLLTVPGPLDCRSSVRSMSSVRFTAYLAPIIVGAILVTPPAVSTARTWHVPGDAPTIQGGINLAQVGDDVLIAAGTYQENDLVMKGGIIVHSENGSEATTVDAQSAGRGFNCADFQGVATIEGLTIVNGRSEDEGGGIRCLRANLVVRSCVITTCTVEFDGGGVYAEDSDVQIENTSIANCGNGDYGGGVEVIRSRLVIHDSVIAGCRGWVAGGGVMGMYSSIDLLDCVIASNRSWSGAGICSENGSQLNVERCVISRNLGDQAGGIGCFGPFSIVDCLIARNRAYATGAGYAARLAGTGVIRGCTVVANMGAGYQYVFQLEGGDVAIERTVVAFHPDGNAFACWNSNATFRCCDVYGNWTDALCGDDLGGNFSADPLFCNAPNDDYTLDGNSPCLPGHNPDGVDCGLVGARGWGCGTLPTGACCFSDGHCEVLEQAACAGQYMGEGTTCDPNPCPPPTGACCLPDGSCAIAEQQQCLDQHGTYMGDGSACVPDPCHSTPTKATTWGAIKSSFR